MGGYCLGVDLGTTFTAVASARDGRTEILSLGHHAAAIPSLVFLREDGSWLVGDPAGRRGLVEPGRLAREFKRRFGDTTAILLGGTPWSADALTSQLLRHVVAEATAQEGSPPERVAVTHPANWGPYKTDLLRQAVRTVGLPGPSALLLTEPEAAARYYAATERVDAGEMVAIYDLGGGTFDATVLAKTDAGFAVVGEPEGIERLGGIDFDEAVLAHVSSFLGPALTDLDPDDPAALASMARLRSDCTAAKEALSADTEVSIPVLLPSVQTEIRLTRSEFEAMIRPTLTDTIAALERSIHSAGVEPARMKVVLLVGGSSRIPLVGQLVAATIGRPVAVDVHPKHAVALGAALAASGEAPAAAARTAGAAATRIGGEAPVPTPAPSGVRASARARSAADSRAGAAASDAGASESAPPPADAAPTGSGSRSRRPLVIGGIAVVLVAVLAVALLSRGSDDEPALAPPEVPTFDVGVYAHSIAPADGAVWLGAGDATVARFGVAETRVTGTIRVGGGDQQVAVAVGAGAVWAADYQAGTVSRIDPASNAVTATVEVGRKPHSVIVAAGSVWVSIEEEGVVVRIEPATRATTRILVRGMPTSLAYGAGTVWVSDPASSKLARIDPLSNTVVGEAESGGCPGRIAADDTTVWVQDNCKESTVFQVDPSTGKVLGSTVVGEDADGLALAKGSLWVANGDDGTVSQVDARSRQVQRTIRVGPDPSAVAADNDSVWVANAGDATVSRIPL